MKNYLKHLFPAVLVLGIIACSDGEAELPEGWTEAQKSEFVQSCLEGDPEVSGPSGATEDQCECFFNAYANAYPYETFASGDTLELDDTAWEVMEQALECFGYDLEDFE